MIPVNIIIAVLLFLLFASTKQEQNKINYSVNKIYSDLWGKQGEKWDSSQIPNFTSTGYKQGLQPIPDFEKGVDVTAFGAVGDGKSDATFAFRQAIIACGTNKSVFIPPGTYLLTDTIHVSKSNISLCGDAKNVATLYFEKGLEELYPFYSKKGVKKQNWSWSGAMLLFDGKINNVGITNLRFRFPDNIWEGHNFRERGYNAIGFGNSVHNGWIKNVTITGADLGLWIDWKARNITAENWILDFGPNRCGQKLSGHHGANIYGGYNLLQNFEIRGQFAHDLSIESKYAIYNVFREGKGTDINIDHHNHGQSKNLFTNLNVGIGTRLYQSGGQDIPRGICTGETFWNINAETDMNYPDGMDRKGGNSKNNVCVGIRTERPSLQNDPNNNWFETIHPVSLYPQDLYLAQLAYFNRLIQP